MMPPRPRPTDGTEKIALLLRGAYPDPETDELVGVSTRAVVIEPSIEGMEAVLISGLGFDRRLAVVSDRTTHAVMGERVERALAGRFVVQSIILPDSVHPDDVTAERLAQESRSADALIAVGSGTINDLCKYVSAQAGKPYAVFATAPSMNGYTSLNASITKHGHKMSLPAQAPLGVFFDLSILAAAPPRLIRAGLGDSLCRATAQADWLLAHLLLDGSYRELPFELLIDDEGPLFENARALLAGDLAVMRRLVNTLVLAGFGTAVVGNSQPASQGEHLISHYIDMFAEESRPLIYHGEQVGVTTLSMARLQERMLEKAPRLRPDAASEADFKARYGDEIGASCWSEFSAKRLDEGRAEALNANISLNWDRIRDRIAAIIIPSARLTAVLAAAGGPLTPERIHLSRAFYETALTRCREIRNRYTFLDLAASSGGLMRMVGTL
jgi:glycerol-1-phosphate dehydrogenase [NAD(P)+]